ncbi:MAG TPA: ROK family protein [Candidatus Saccharimonadales bacterium]|nr:ROK family protein [Candidatus Saccharimonadales bacterium]
MYLGIDIGGTKTLVACLDNHGVITESLKFPTAPHYPQFIRDLAETVASLSTKEFIACGVGAPGRLDRKKGIGLAMGNLPWEDVPIGLDVEKIAHCPVVIENDAKLAALSEAMLVKDKYDRVVYVTVSTGIGVGVVINQQIDPYLANAEAGKMPLEHNGKMVPWESFASGRAITRRYGKMAKDIHDKATWKHIAHDIARGLIDIIAVVQPEVVILGGSVAAYFDRFGGLLVDALRTYEVPLIPIPPIIAAGRPEEAVVYGCYDLAKGLHGKARP